MPASQVLLRVLLFLTLCICSLEFDSVTISAQTGAVSPPTPSAKDHVCSIRHTPPNDGDTALAKTEYDTALTYFRAAIAKDPASQEAHLGLVLSLIGKNQTVDAIKEADAMIAASPRSAIAQVAAAEAAYRNADFTGMRAHVTQALANDSCEGRALDLVATLYYVNARFGSEARAATSAHLLRPDDEIVRRNWMETLPRSKRILEVAKYLSGPNALSAKDLTYYKTSEEHDKAYRPGECRITSKAESTKIPFIPIYGDHSAPHSFGLEVAFNGKKRHMEIDTGASGIVLSGPAARGLGLIPEYHLQTGGVGDEGRADSYLTHVAQIQIGDVTISDCMVDVVEKSHLDVDGLIGLNVFRRWLTTLDYPNEKLILNPLPARTNLTGVPTLATASPTVDPDEDEQPLQDAVEPPQMKGWLHMVRVGHQILLPASINRGPVHYMMADTGASKTLLSVAFAKEVGKTHDADVTFTGISGKVNKSYSVDNASLQFDRLALPATSYFAINLDNISHGTGVEVSGFVGLPTLSRLTITIDYRDNLIDLRYDPKHDVMRF